MTNLLIDHAKVNIACQLKGINTRSDYARDYRENSSFGLLVLLSTLRKYQAVFLKVC